jgi:hypothetical protein
MAFQDLLTRHSHHHNISVICTTQNYFTASDVSATLLRQYTHIIVFNAKVERAWLLTLGQRLSSNPRCLEQAFAWMAKHTPLAPLQYLVIDASSISHLPHNLSIRSQIIPADGSKTIMPLFFCLADEK